MVGQMVGYISLMSVTGVYDVNNRVETVRVTEGINVVAADDGNLLNDVLILWLDDIPLSLLRTRMHAWQRSLRLCQGDPSIPWLLRHKRWKVNGVAANLSRSQPYRKSVIKQDVYADGRQFKSKDILKVTIKATSDAVETVTVKNLTDTMTNCFFEVIHRNSCYVSI